jgi:glycosyltransferase involved in cell wall biosynthesis
VGAGELLGVSRATAFEASSLLGTRRDDLPTGWPASLRYWSATARTSWALRRAVERAGASLVHTNALKSHLLAGASTRLPQRPLVWHMRDILPAGPARQWLLRACHQLNPYVIAISQAVAEQFGPLRERIRLRVIYNGVPLARFAPGPPSPALAAELGLRPDDEVVAVVGRLAPWKGHRTLLQAMRQVVDQRPRARLLVVGEVTFWEESYANDLRRQTEELGLTAAVVWAGFRRDVAEMLRLCDVFVLPSTNEPFGRALVEAMATGKPAIGTRSGGVPEVVKEGETGLLVEPGNPGELAAAISRLLAEPSMAAELGEAGHRRANRHFCVTRVAREVQEVYEQLLGR